MLLKFNAKVANGIFVAIYLVVSCWYYIWLYMHNFLNKIFYLFVSYLNWSILGPKFLKNGCFNLPHIVKTMKQCNRLQKTSRTFEGLYLSTLNMVCLFFNRDFYNCTSFFCQMLVHSEVVLFETTTCLILFRTTLLIFGEKEKKPENVHSEAIIF